MHHGAGQTYRAAQFRPIKVQAMVDQADAGMILRLSYTFREGFNDARKKNYFNLEKCIFYAKELIGNPCSNQYNNKNKKEIKKKNISEQIK